MSQVSSTWTEANETALDVLLLTSYTGRGMSSQPGSTGVVRGPPTNARRGSDIVALRLTWALTNYCDLQ